MQTHPHPSSPLSRLLPDSASVSLEGVLHIASHSIPDLARRYDTPLYIFDRATIINACNTYRRAFAEFYRASAAQILYASKAYLSPLIARLIAGQGMGLDVVSGGELLVARAANFPLESVSFHGNNKSEAELRMALDMGVGRIVLDNWSELERLTRVARGIGRRPGVLVRVAPAVETTTHPYLQTGQAASKFGFPLSNGEAKAAALRILREDQLHLLGLHAHAGTMLREPRPYQESLAHLLALAGEIYREVQWWPEEISPGGGWAIDTPGADSPVPEVGLLARALQHTMRQGVASISAALPPPALIVEPGRSIVGRAGVAVYRVGARKATPGGITYLFVDGGMGDNIRPALYGAPYTALAVERAQAPVEENVCVTGRYCESGDMLIHSVMLPYMQEGELLALPTAGAYCLPLASNYNLVPRPAVLLVDGERVEVMERRETYHDVLSRYQDKNRDAV